jgi:putative transposase
MKKKETNLKLRRKNVAAIDLGLCNLATVTFNQNKNPLLIKGGVLKSTNHYFNKKLAKYKSICKKTDKLYLKRNNKIKDYLHKSSRYIINQLVSNNVGTLVIGHNKYQKQEINIGKKNNQNFVSIPFYQFIKMLKYKSQLLGIKVKITTEEYTSKCSFLDNERSHKHKKYKGKRIKRGLFRTSSGRIINADVNGSYNIMKKAIPNCLKTNEIQDVVVHPIRIKSYKSSF